MMKTKTKWLIGISIGLLLLVFTSWQIFKSLKIEKQLKNIAKKELNKLWPNRVQFDYDELSINLFDKTASLSEISLLLFEKNGIDTLGTVNISKLSAHWSSYKDFFTEDTIRVNTIYFDRIVSNLPFDFEKLVPMVSEEPVNFRISVNAIEVLNSEMSFYAEKSRKEGKLFTKYEFTIQNIFFDREKEIKSLMDGIGGAALTLTDTDYFLADGFHRLQLNKAVFLPLKKTVHLNGASFKPIFDWSEFAALKKEVSNHISVEVDSLSLAGINLLAGRAFIAEELAVFKPRLRVRRDKNYLLPDDRFVPVFVDMIEEMDFPLYLRNLIVKNMDLEYFEKADGKYTAGKFAISNINGTVENLTNIADSVSSSDLSLNILASGQVYNEALLEAKIIYELQSEDGAFVGQGSLSPMNMVNFNEYLANIYPVTVSRGSADGIYFNFWGNRLKSSGEMRFKYSDLKVAVDTGEENKDFKQSALSFLANTVLASYNPRPNGRFRVGEIDFQRDTRKSMFAYWAGIIVSGMKSTLGASPAAETEKNVKGNRKESLWRKLGFGKEESK